MKYRVEITRRAKADITRVYEWMAEEGGRAPSKWHQELVSAIERLEVLPLRCPLAVRETSAFGVETRILLVRRYRVFFTVRGRTVYVLAVRHQARRPPGD